MKLPQRLAPLGLLAVLRATDLSEDTPACLKDNFYGIYGDRAVFRASDAACLELISVTFKEGSWTTVLPQEAAGQQLVWIEETSLDDSLRTPDYEAEVTQFVHWLHAPHSDAQTVLSKHDSAGRVTVMYGDDDDDEGRAGVPRTLVVADMSALHALFLRLPRFWRASPLPSSPTTYLPVSDTATQRVRDLLACLRFDPVVAAIVDGLSLPQLRADVRFLTNEDGRSGIVSRHSFHQGSRVAARWLKARLEDAGAGCRLMPFLEGFAPNVVCRYIGTTEPSSIVLISGHYDSRGSFGLERAPGGNDDGSGTISILNIARRIKATGTAFRRTVELVLFAGEEQGLLGSKAYARELRERGADVVLMIQADMLAYHDPGEPPQIGLPKSIGSPEVAQLVANVSALYSPELHVGVTAVCCSDHQSFHEQGYPATHLFERAGPIADPMYHNSGDISDRPGYDLQQVRSISKVQFATLLHAAGFDLPLRSASRTLVDTPIDVGR